MSFMFMVFFYSSLIYNYRLEKLLINPLVFSNSFYTTPKIATF